MTDYDFVIIGAGVIGTSVAHHLAQLGHRRVLVVDQHSIGAGTTAQSSGILRTHYSVRQNVQLAQRAWRAFEDFAAYVEDPEASCGLVRCGYLISAPPGAQAAALTETIRAQQAMGIEARFVTPGEAHERLPIARFDAGELIAYEPDAGFADAYLVASSFARSARRGGVRFLEGEQVTGLLRDGARVVGIRGSTGNVGAAHVISTQNVWSSQLGAWLGCEIPVVAERHTVLALEAAAGYRPDMPVFKDLASAGLMYYRSYGGKQMLASEGTAGERLPGLQLEQGDVPLEYVADVAGQIVPRFPAYESAALASSWTGVYDVTPDWNPVLGSVAGVEGLTVGFGFSGHGFKLSPVVGRLLAQHACGLAPDFSLEPYRLDRFDRGQPLVGRYGRGAVS